jgi:heptosyltransferase-1
VHLAAALERPTVALYTDTSPLLTGIYPPDERLGINLGDAGRIPLPADVRTALAQLAVWER